MVRLSTVSSSWMEEGTSQVVVGGSWLSQFGFTTGKQVVIDVSMGQIIIRLVDGEDTDGVEL